MGDNQFEYGTREEIIERLLDEATNEIYLEQDKKEIGSITPRYACVMKPNAIDKITKEEFDIKEAQRRRILEIQAQERERKLNAERSTRKTENSEIVKAEKSAVVKTEPNLDVRRNARSAVSCQVSTSKTRQTASSNRVKIQPQSASQKPRPQSTSTAYLIRNQTILPTQPSAVGSQYLDHSLPHGLMMDMGKLKMRLLQSAHSCSGTAQRVSDEERVLKIVERDSKGIYSKNVFFKGMLKRMIRIKGDEILPWSSHPSKTFGRSECGFKPARPISREKLQLDIAKINTYSPYRKTTKTKILKQKGPLSFEAGSFQPETIKLQSKDKDITNPCFFIKRSRPKNLNVCLREHLL